MATNALGTPISEGGVRAVNFFNGRLLSGRDLSREQDSRRLADSRVGQACGPGLAWGLEVSAAGAASTGVVQVTAGLAVAPSGLVLCLTSDQSLTLVVAPDTTTASDSSGFAPCGVLSDSTYVAGAGVFLLTLAPTSVAEGNAPVLALEAVNTRCTTDAYVEAVQFRLLRISGYSATGTSDAAVARLRNEIADAAFDQTALAASHRLPGQTPAAAALGTLNVQGRSDCDVPLAVVYLVDQRVVFVDRWSVRRRLAADPASNAWGTWFGERPVALGEARLAQFQDHLSDTPALAGAAASAALGWLPPAGFLPAATAWRTFLGAQAPAAEVLLDPGDAPDIVANALRDDAVVVGSAVRFRVYRVGASGPLLFVRDSRNVHHAEQLWLDGDRAGLSGAADVQTAIDRLRAGTCLHLALRPDMDVARVLAALPAAQDASLCFEAGDYKFRKALRIKGLGRVSVHGCGANLVNLAGECALQVVGCAAVSVRELTFEGRVAGNGKDELGIGLNGALTVVDTPIAHIERVSARCADAATLGAVAIVVAVRNVSVERLPSARFTVSDCEVTVGAAQQGLMCLNADVTRIRRNSVAGAETGVSLRRGIVVAGRQAGTVLIDDNVIVGVEEGISVGVSEAADEKTPPLHADRVVIERNRVELDLSRVTTGGRFGIFVGNAKSVAANANSVKVMAGFRDKSLPAVQAIRLNGAYGAQIILRDNVFDGASVGIAFQPRSAPPAGALWLFQYNVATPATAVVLNLPAKGAPAEAAVVETQNRSQVVVGPLLVRG